MKVLDRIIEIINKEAPFSRELSDKEKELLFNVYLLTADPFDIDERLLTLQDEYLEDKYKDRGVDFVDAVRSRQRIEPIDIRTDMLIVFSDNLIVNHEDLTTAIDDSVDNQLVCRAGLKFKSGLYRLFERDRFVLSYTNPYIVDGYNLRARKVAKVIVDSKCDLTESVDKLFDNIESLVTVMKSMDLKNVVVLIECLPSRLKNDKNIIKNIKNTLKMPKIKRIFI